MKKILTIATVVFAATALNAASWQWKLTGTMYNGTADTALTSGTVYLFDAGVTSQDALLQAFFAGTTDISSIAVAGAPAIALTSAGKGSGTSDFFDYGDSSAKSFYVALVNGEDIFVSATKSVTGSDTGSVAISSPSVSTPSRSTIEFAEGDSFSSAGWYSAAAVPEPTSGLLILLGMAGLALRRRRA